MSDPSPYKAPSARIPAKWMEEETPRTGGWRKALMILGGLFAALIVLFIAGFGVMAYMGRGLDDSSKRYAIEAAHAIANQWDQQALQSRLSPEFQALLKPGDLEKWFEVYRKLGDLKQPGEAQGQANISMTTAKGKLITAQYRFSGEFENGPAEILIALIQHQEQWQISGFRVNAPVFAKP